MTCSNVQIKYPGDGTTVDFTVPFLYQEQSEVKVSLWDTTTQDYVSVTEYDGTDQQDTGHYYQWQNATVIRMVNQEGVNDPPPVPTEDIELNTAPPSLLIYRDTDLSSMNAEFYPGSSIKAQDLNSNFEQLQFAIEESKCDVETLKGDVALNYWNKTTETLYSGDTWQDSDEFIVTAAAGDDRWLSATPGPGPGVNLVSGIGTSVNTTSGDVAYDVVQSTFWGQAYPATTATGTASSISGNMTGVGTIQFGVGSTYQFPVADGSAGNVLATDGGGNLLWIIPSGGGGGGTDAVVVFNVASLNSAAEDLTSSDAGAIYLVQDSTNINTTADPAVTGLPSAPQGGWSGEIQTTLQWSGTAWTFLRYAAKDPDTRYVNVSGDTMTGLLTLSGAPTADLNAATKKYVDDSIPTTPTVNNTKITLAAGTNMSGGGDFTLNQGTAKTITFNATASFIGGEVDASITTPERTITTAFDLSTGPYWTCGAIAIPNPTDAVSGMAGLIRVTAEPVSWGGNFSTAPTPTVFPSIIPFYVQAADNILLGQAVGVA